jgi:hypothetical protein
MTPSQCRQDRHGVPAARLAMTARQEPACMAPRQAVVSIAKVRIAAYVLSG